jgi:hypothetical protein
MKLFICALALMTLAACGAAWADGPQCTVAYPQGFNVTNYKLVKTKKGVRVLRMQRCMNGDLEATWRGCELRYHA